MGKFVSLLNRICKFFHFLLSERFLCHDSRKNYLLIIHRNAMNLRNIHLSENVCTKCCNGVANNSANKCWQVKSKYNLSLWII